MKIKNIDLEMIAELLKGVPDEMDLQSIEFSQNNVRLNFAADYDIMKRENTAKAASELFQLIKSIEAREKLGEIENGGNNGV